MFDEVSLFLDGLIAFSPDRGADLALDLFSCKLGLNLPHDIFRKQNNRFQIIASSWWISLGCWLYSRFSRAMGSLQQSTLILIAVVLIITFFSVEHVSGCCRRRTTRRGKYVSSIRFDIVWWIVVAFPLDIGDVLIDYFVRVLGPSWN